MFSSVSSPLVLESISITFPTYLPPKKASESIFSFIFFACVVSLHATKTIDGIIVNTDTTYLEKQFFEMHKIGVNVNQLARLANATGSVTPEEMKELKELKGMIKEIWHILRSSASNLQ